MRIKFSVNGQKVDVTVSPRETLLDVLRDRLGLTGTKYGCGEGECGACTVIFNRLSANSCLILAPQAHGAEILTIEGFDVDPVGYAVKRAFAETGAVQCGFCTPGMVVSARALLTTNPRPTRDEIKQGLCGNICRCTGYIKILEAVESAAATL